MQNQKQTAKINHFLSLVSPMLADVVRTILRSLDWPVTEEGSGLDLTFCIKNGEKQIKFYLQNLLLEIATVDRDEQPVRFDERLRDFDYFLSKMVSVTQSKLNVLFHLLGQEDVDAAIDNIAKDAQQYERIRIWKFDSRKPP